MAYQTYTTEAIVCGSFASKTADKSYMLFTRDAGMVYATARSVREERSRQRYALQDFSLVSVSLIKGKSGWRIGSVEAIRNYFLESALRAVRTSVFKQVRLLRRYVQGETPDSALYAEVKQQLDTLVSPVLSNRLVVEQVAHTRLLHHLGYIALAQPLSSLVNGSFSEVLPKLTQVALSKKLALAISQADTVSHL